ncbi:MAG: DUF2283 domain-containing protein [Acidobacteriota bacterium]
MKQVYLEVTYRDGRPFAAYLYLSSKSNEKRHKCRRIEPGMIVDINREGKLLGIELTAPALVTLQGINAILREYDLEPLEESALAPLVAA